MSKRKKIFLGVILFIIFATWVLVDGEIIGYKKVRIQYLCSYNIAEDVEDVAAAYLDRSEMIEVVKKDHFQNENDKQKILDILYQVDDNKGIFWSEGKKIRTIKTTSDHDSLSVKVKTKGKNKKCVYLYTTNKNNEFASEYTFVE